MTDPSPAPAPAPAFPRDPAMRRALGLDALAAILPMDRRDRLAELLTDDDVATLKHLAREGMGENSLRGLASDLAYLEAWALASTSSPLPWPAPEALALKFVAHHLWDPARRDADPSHGMPADVAASLRAQNLLRAEGPHAPATVRRRLSSWATLHHWKGADGPFKSAPLRAALRLSVRAGARPRMRKSARAVTLDVLEQLLSTCGSDRLVDARDAALLLVAFGSGGRRRSEVAGLRIEQLIEEGAILEDPADPGSTSLPCLSIRLGRTKTAKADEDTRVLLVGRPVEALREWLARAGIAKGPVFRAIDQWGGLDDKAMTPQAVNWIVKRRAAAAGLDPKLYSAHGLRSGYLTEAAREGVPLPEAMQQSQHRSIQQAASYYNDSERKQGRAARLASIPKVLPQC
ncbi:site-specific integrase [Methylocapsa palsarum]|uniref:Phage integrase family protein n=1 Tax=Methylocapsa palsarum TaxID=1612308 RepID=A0A1I3VVZ4_9HYPH|nr:site-specific integrase [Methylocapsa palsarum]SFJ99330.1 Phage integrase family protein [Methylocapsa palsarum]